MNKTAIIVGAGPAGLTAAYELLKQESGIHPVILEESDAIGGISRTVVHNGNRIDIGGHRFFSKSEPVMNLWKELLPVQGSPSLDDAILGREKPWAQGGPDPAKTDRVMLLRDRVSRIFYLRHFFDYPISIKFQTFRNMGLLRTLKSGLGYLAAAARKREEKSLEDFYINRFGKTLYRMFFEDYTEKLWGIHPAQISPEWGAQRVKGLSLSKAVLNVLAKPFRKKGAKVETSLIESFLYPKKGPGQYWETMADEIRKMGGEIVMNARVVGLETENGRITAVETEENGARKRRTGDLFFSSMPVKDLVAALPGAPEAIAEIAAALPYRDFITVGLLVDALKIKNQTALKTLGGIVPDCWIYIQERDVKLGRLQIFNNWSPYMVGDPQKHVWIGLEYFCSEGDALWSMSDPDFIRFAIDELVKIDILAASAVRDSVRIRVKKAYPAYFGAYARFGEVRAWLDAFPNLYCIGRNGQHRYNNMDHSMLTAVEAVKAALSGASKNRLWCVNTEEEYHEGK